MYIVMAIIVRHNNLLYYSDDLLRNKSLGIKLSHVFLKCHFAQYTYSTACYYTSGPILGLELLVGFMPACIVGKLPGRICS